MTGDKPVESALYQVCVGVQHSVDAAKLLRFQDSSPPASAFPPAMEGKPRNSNIVILREGGE